ncbi:MAG: hypothetical protein HN742_17625 [Lentisphaerae bacterium]|jgi:hypothetical protein|nr:hypothetical protein [Lentisphaerota bacterium]MBT5611935.1 hypothetical protein [Lentisphaerota bacterium]MBT7057911.1 hypothetical protein [Lentisphaerota bacterium]MBT7843702.1 hypothetical protein [Lentisphaerota bacterium]
MSKHMIAWVVGSLLASAAVFAGESPVCFGKTTVSTDVVTQGAAVDVTIPFEPETGWQYRAYRIIAYRPCVPSACLTVLPWPLSKSKHGRKWDSFGIRKWTWHDMKKPQPSTLEVTLSTAGWPPGDYRLHASLLFRNDSLPRKEGGQDRDRYLSRQFHLSVLPAATKQP